MAEGNFQISHTRNIIVIGTIGTGKSTLINRIIGDDCLRTGFSLSRITKEIEQVSGLMEFDGKKYNITCIDSAGLIDPSSDFDKQLTNPHIIDDIKMAISITFKVGVSIIFLVLDISRLRIEERNLFKYLQEHFGPSFWKKCFIVFTHCDILTDDGKEAAITEFKSSFEGYGCLKQFIGSGTWEDARRLRVKTVGLPTDSEVTDELAIELAPRVENDIYMLRKIVKEAVSLEPSNNVLRPPQRNCCVM